MHRISFKHFVLHDVLHGTFHLEKGMLFTAKQALIRPGTAALDYISGKRVPYYNVFYFILLVIGLNVLLTHYYNDIALHVAPEKMWVAKTNDVGERLDEMVTHYGKWMLFAMVPLTAFNSFMLFKRNRFNFSEHAILSGILLLGICLMITFAVILSFIPLTGIRIPHFDFLYTLLPCLVLVYVVYGYYDAFRKKYSLAGFSYRMFLFLLFFLLECTLFFIIILGMAIHWERGARIEYRF